MPIRREPASPLRLPLRGSDLPLPALRQACSRRILLNRLKTESRYGGCHTSQIQNVRRLKDNVQPSFNHTRSDNDRESAVLAPKRLTSISNIQTGDVEARGGITAPRSQSSFRR